MRVSENPTFAEFAEVYAVRMSNRPQCEAQWNDLSVADRRDAIACLSYHARFCEQRNAMPCSALEWLLTRWWQRIPARIAAQLRDEEIAPVTVAAREPADHAATPPRRARTGSGSGTWVNVGA